MSSAPAARFAAPVVLLLALALALGTAGCGKGQGKALVTTGSRRLTVEQFEEYGRDPQIIQPYVALPESAQKKALFDDLLKYEILAEAGTRAGFDKDSVYVHIERDNLPRLLPDALYDKHIGNAVKVTEAEAKLFYDAQQTEHRLAVILAMDDAVAKAALARLAAGDKFADVAKSLSQDPSSAPSGGEIPGWISLGQLPPEIEKALTPLKVGEHTGAIPQRTGSYIFSVLETRPRKDPAPFESNKQNVISMLESRKKGALVDQYLIGLKSQYALKTDGPGWKVLNDKMLTLPDSLSHYLASDPHKAGMTDAELGQTIASWTGHNYTVQTLITDMSQTPMNERPPSNNVNMVKMFVEGKAMNDILVAEATKEGLATSPRVKGALARARSSYLVQKYVEKTIPASAVGFPSPAELDSTTTALVSAAGGHVGADLKFQALPPQVQQQIVADWQNKRRQALLNAEIDRLKAEYKPVIDEAALKAIPWPIPAAADKETA
jgi:hypothetical protein